MAKQASRTPDGGLPNAEESLVVLTLTKPGQTPADEWGLDKRDALIRIAGATVALDYRFPGVMIARLETAPIPEAEERALIVQAFGGFDRFSYRRTKLGEKPPFEIYDDRGENDPQLVFERYLASPEGFISPKAKPTPDRKPVGRLRPKRPALGPDELPWYRKED